MLLTPGLREIDKKDKKITIELDDLKKWDFEKRKVIDYEVQEKTLYLNIVENLEIKTIEILIDIKDKKQDVICYEFLTKAFDYIKYCFGYDIGRELSNYYKRQYLLFDKLKNQNNKNKIINQFPILEKYESRFFDVITEFSFRTMESTDILQSYNKNGEYFANCAVLKSKEEKNKIKVNIYGCDDSSYSYYCNSIEEAHLITMILRTEYAIDTERLVKELNFTE